MNSMNFKRFIHRLRTVTTTIDPMFQASVGVAVVPEASVGRLARKAVIQPLQQLRLTQLRRSLQTRLQAVATTILRRLRMTSQPARLAPPDIHRSDLRPEQDSAVFNPELALASLIQEHRPQPAVLLILVLKQLADLHTQLLVSVQPDRLLGANDHRQLAVDLPAVSFQRSRHRQAELALVQAFRAAAAAADHHRRASKMRAKKETTRPFPESQRSTTRSTQKSLRRRSTAASKSSPATTLTLKPDAKCSTSAL